MTLSTNEDEYLDFVRFWSGVADYMSIQNLVDNGALQEHNVNVVPDQREYKDFQCNKLNQRIYIRFHGGALPCGYVFGWDDMQLGDLNEVTVKDVWKNEKFEELRQLHARKEYYKDKHCYNCGTSHRTGDLEIEEQLGENA